MLMLFSTNTNSRSIPKPPAKKIKGGMEMNNYKPVTVYPLVESDDWMNETGKLPVKMTNDYLFRALLQSDNETLKALLASLLHMQKEEIVSAVVTNPIMLGEAIGDKTFILDVTVEMNGGALFDLEMQVVMETGLHINL